MKTSDTRLTAKRITHADGAAQENESRLKALFDLLPMGIAILDAERRVVFANPALKRIMGIPDEDLQAAVQRRWVYLRSDGTPMPPEEYASTQAMQSQQPVFDVETGLVQPNGHVVWTAASALPIAFPDWSVALVVRDITAQKEAQEALRASEQRFRTLYAEAERRRRERDLLDEVRSALAHEMDLAEVLRQVVEAIARTFGYAQVSLYLLEGDALHLQHQVGYSTPIFTIPITRGVSGRVARTRQPSLLTDVRTDQSFLGAIAGIESEVCVPLLIEDQVIGVLNIESTGDVILSQADLELMTALSEHVSLAIARARLHTQVRKSEQLLQESQIIAGLGSYVVDVMAGRWTSSEMLDHIFGIDAAFDRSVAGWETLVHPDERQAMSDYFSHHVIGQGKRFDRVYRIIRHSDGAVRWVHDLGRLEFDGDGRPVAMTGTIQDITERKQAEERAFELALERERVALLNTFVQNASHEFRTPLTIIRTNLYLLERASDPVKRQQKQAQIDQQIMGITRLVDMLAEIVRLDSRAAFTLRSTDLNALVGAAAAALAGRTAANRLTLHLQTAPALPLMRVDADRLQVALRELLDNAVRFTPAGGRIEVRTASLPDAVTIEVQDNGPGILPEIQSRVFDRFYRQDASHTTPGFGLGLPIARLIVERHGGRLEMESQPGTGSLFRIVLPL